MQSACGSVEENIRGRLVSFCSQWVGLWVYDLDSVNVHQPVDIGVCLTLRARFK